MEDKKLAFRTRHRRKIQLEDRLNVGRTVLSGTMLSHGRHPSKRPATIGANKRFLSCVNPAVVQGVRVVERFVVARAAEEDPDAAFTDEALPNATAWPVFKIGLPKVDRTHTQNSNEDEVCYSTPSTWTVHISTNETRTRTKQYDTRGDRLEVVQSVF